MAAIKRLQPLLYGQFGSKIKNANFLHLFCVETVSSALDLHKDKKLSAVPLDVAPELRTKRCSPRFRPGGRFWNQVSDTCRQAGRERNVGP